MTDLRPAIENAARTGRRRQVMVLVPGTVLLLVCGLAIVLGAPRGAEAGLYVLGAGCVGLGLAGAVGIAMRALGAVPPPPCTAALGAVTASAVLRSRRDFVVGMAMIVVMVAACGTWSGLALGGGAIGWGFLFAALAVHLFSVVALAASGRYTAGGVWLTPEGVLYRSKGLQSWVRWGDVGLAVADEPDRSVRIVAHQGTAVEHTYRAGFWRGEKSAGPMSAVLGVEGMALIATDLARTIEFYASQPAARSELGTEAALARIASRRQEAVSELVGTSAVAVTDTASPATLGVDPAAQPRGRWRSRGIRLAIILGGVAFVALGASVVVSADGETAGTVIGVAVIAFGMAAGVEQLLEMTRRPPALRVVAGAMPGATRLPRAVWPLGARVVYASANAAVLLALAGLAVSEGAPIWGTAYVLGAAPLLSFPIFVALGLVRAGGLLLTVEGIEHRSRGMVARVPWLFVGEVGFALNGRVRVDVPSGNAERTFAAPWWRGGRFPQRAIDIDTTYLDITAWGLTHVLNYYRDHPDQRGELGMPGVVARRALESA